MLKIITAEQQQELDKYSIENEPVLSIDLMERAAFKCSNFLNINTESGFVFHIFCGNGNNGGDGLAIARQLYHSGKSCLVYLLNEVGSENFNINLNRWKQLPSTSIIILKSVENFPVCSNKSIIVDALFGTGLNRTVEGIAASLIKHLNKQQGRRVSIDVPSGLFTNKVTTDLSNVFHASATITFHSMKESFLYAEYSTVAGNIFIADLKLNTEHERTLKSKKYFIDENDIVALIKPRLAAGHKGTFGHAYLLAGSEGMAGAAILASKAILRSGAGMVTVHTPSACLLPLQCSNPEVMVEKDDCETHITTFKITQKYDAIGVGPGIGTDPETANALKKLIQESNSAIVLDADAITILATNPTWISFLPKGSILTPHMGEFAKLAGNISDPFERINTLSNFAKKHNLFMLLKGQYSALACPDGAIYYNSSGNSGMATAGSGDVLTGIITGLLAQGYSPGVAAMAGMYLHGKAGDKAAITKSESAMIASDIIENL